MRTVRTIVTLSAALLVSLSVLATEQPATLRIGTDPGYAPFESKSPDGKVIGFDIDLTEALCERMKMKCVVVESPFDALIPSLKARKIDAIMATMSITPARQKEINFSDKLYSAKARLIAPAGSALKPEPASLQGKNIGVLQGSIQETYANKYWRNSGVSVVSYPSQDDIYSDLKAGRLDAAFQDEVAGSYGFLKQAAGKSYDFAGPAVTDPQIFGTGVGMGLRKEDTELQQAVNQAFASLRADGTYKKIVDKYFAFDIY
ncbi:ABC transporter substrate-binding protein [Cedecea colo]|uniref:ABC transporter substrate-binding protein n=1 Tax=Cedecea colo TaxID=2552946 RepID=A0ABX0VN49_9ENTR|nr:ABC transporter substrate-binding protein [Cedecea colo]NIY48486.1 ABC transporter substrate-binding protein [Cedecea colo]